jgi:glycine cleavage system H lipoate-binding protein
MKTYTKMAEVFGFQVPTETYYLRRGHAWAVLEGEDQVRVGLDDFSQKILGPADQIKFPEVGKVYYQDHLCMALFREGRKASFEAPLDGAIEALNTKVRQQPRLIHDDPYGEGWIFLMKPVNLPCNLAHLSFDEADAAWIDAESHRLMNLMDTRVGFTLPDGGVIVDDVYGHYQELGWRPLVQEFFLQNLTKKGFLPGMSPIQIFGGSRTRPTMRAWCRLASYPLLKTKNSKLKP